MSDFYEVDFIDVPSNKGGDAIAIRYCLNGQIKIHIVDGGYIETGDKITSHINKYYNNPTKIENVILTHQDGDHAGGIRTILENFEIGTLWMLRPWLYADELLPGFTRYTNKENLVNRLKEIYSNISTLENIANEKRINIAEPFQGSKIGPFTVISPTKEFFLKQVLQSDKTPVANNIDSVSLNSFSRMISEAVKYIKRQWGVENFSDDETSAENEMSIIQYAKLCGDSIMLTGDAGREALEISRKYLVANGVSLPKIDRFQVPHHGSRRNLSSGLLNAFLGNKLVAPLDEGNNNGFALISASEKDDEHPKKSVVRALLHRGYKIGMTKGKNLWFSSDAPQRSDYSSIPAVSYPDEEEE